MGVMLSAGGSLRWLRDLIQLQPYEMMMAEAAAVPAGCEGLIFLPYLSGERTPHADPQARGAFIGLTLRHGRAHMIRAVLEGVAMGLRDCLEIVRRMSLPLTEVRVSGGGARSRLWRQILADMFTVEAVSVSTTEGAAYGAALLAGVGCGIHASVEAACDASVTVMERIASEPERASYYRNLFEVYRGLYPTLRPAMHQLSAEKLEAGPD